MAKSQDQTATFMMLYLGDFSSKLWIPAKFVTKHKEIAHQVSVMLETDDSENCWEVKIKRVNADLYMKDGWSEFVKDNELTELDFLTFRLLHESTSFKVSIYGGDGCPKHPTSPSSGGGDVEMLHETKARVENASGIKRGRGRPPKFDAELNIAHGTDMNKKRQSKARNDVVVVGSSRSSKKSNPLYLEMCLKWHQQSRISLPAAFWKVGGMRGRRDVMMEYVATRDCKSVVLDHRLYRTDLARGWPEFRKANGIVVGKTYSFEFNPNQNVIRVKEVRTNEQQGN